MKRLALISTHPIQYNAPLFRLIHERGRIDLCVFYTWSQSEAGSVYDPGFGQARSWDIPLLEGYRYEFVPNTSNKPGSHHFWGIQNPGLIARIKAFQPDAICVYGWNFHSHLAVMRHFKGVIPIWFRGDSTLLDEPTGFAWRKLLRRTLLRVIFRYVDRAFFVGQSNRDYFKAHGLDESQLVYAPHAIDNQRFSEQGDNYEMEAEQWRTQLGITNNKPSFLFAGKLEAKKNVRSLVQAFKQLPDAQLIVVGNGVLEQALREDASGVSSIHFLPFQNQSRMPAVYRLADFFILPSVGPGETWGLALNEAMASGRPVIASHKCGGAKDLIQEGKNGFITTGTVDDIKRVVHLCLNANYLDLKGATLQQIGQFTLSRIAQSYEDSLTDK